jgi:hypothetical protein
MADDKTPVEPGTSPGKSESKSTLRVGTFLGLVSSGWLFYGAAQGHMGRPWPCVFIGAAILVCIAVAYLSTTKRVLAGVLICTIGIFGLLIGQGAVFASAVGVAAGGFIVTSRTGAQSGDSS